jgi:hypothetical protein
MVDALVYGIRLIVVGAYLLVQVYRLAYISQ